MTAPSCIYLLGSEQAAGAADARPRNDGARGEAEVLHHVNGDTGACPAQPCANYSRFEFVYIWLPNASSSDDDQCPLNRCIILYFNWPRFFLTCFAMNRQTRLLVCQHQELSEYGWRRAAAILIHQLLDLDSLGREIDLKSDTRVNGDDLNVHCAQS